MADAVNRNPSPRPTSLLTGKFTGNFARILVCSPSRRAEIPRLAGTSGGITKSKYQGKNQQKLGNSRALSGIRDWGLGIRDWKKEKKLARPAVHI